MRPGSFPFVWVVFAAGVLCLLFIIGNLWVLGLHRYPADTRLYVGGGLPERGKQAFQVYGCGGCHVIPGVANATGRVGPKLAGLDQQTYIAGVLFNSPENLVEWLQRPQKIAPHSAMPDLGVTQQDAEDMAAYLYSMPNG